MKNNALFQIISLFLIPGYLFSTPINLASNKISDVCRNCLHVDFSYVGAFNSYKKSLTQMPSKALSVCTCFDNNCNFKNAIFSRNSRTYRSVQIRTDSAKFVNDQMLKKIYSFGQMPLFPFWAGSGKNKAPDGCQVLRI
jgi:hypothetical protein